MGFTNPIKHTSYQSHDRKIESSDIQAAVTKILSQHFGRRHPIKTEGVKGQTIFIRVPSSPWKMEVLWNEPEILSRTKKLLTNKTVQKIIVVQS